MIKLHRTPVRPSGFTLIELLITVVIIGIMAAIATPVFWNAYQRARFSTESRNLLSTLRLARSLAIASKSQYGVYFNGTYNNSGVGNALKYTLFKDVKKLSEFEFNESGDSIMRVDVMTPGVTYMFTDLEDEVIIFGPRGNANFEGGGNIEMVVDKDNVFEIRQINVLNSTGRIKLTVQ